MSDDGPWLLDLSIMPSKNAKFVVASWYARLTRHDLVLGMIGGKFTHSIGLRGKQVVSQPEGDSPPDFPLQHHGGSCVLGLPWLSFGSRFGYYW